MGSSGGEGLPQLYFELVYASKCQNGQVAVLKCLQYGRKLEKMLKNYLSFKLKFIPKKKLGNGKLWLYQLEREPYFPYGKRAQIGKVSKLLLILIITHGTAIWIFIRTPGGRLKLLNFLCS